MILDRFVPKKISVVVFSTFTFVLLINLISSSNYTPDSFAYIEGAKNILNHSNFKYDANQQDITIFAPLYSLLLASSMLVWGCNMQAIIFVNISLFLISIYIIHKHFIYKNAEVNNKYLMLITGVLLYPYF